MYTLFELCPGRNISLCFQAMPPEKKGYGPDQLRSAISLVKQNRMTVAAAAREFNIPDSTLRDHVNGKVTYERKGPPSILSCDQETAIVDYAKNLSWRGFPVTRCEVRSLIQDLTKV